METPNTTELEREAKENAKKKALENAKQKATIVNIDEIADQEARKAADAYMTEEKGKANFFKKMWKHTFFDEYYRQRQINRVKEEIKEKGNIYSGRLDEENSQIAHKNAMLGITERFQAEYEGTLSEGEDKKILNKENPEAIRVKKEITDLINTYASSKTMTEAAFQNAKTRILDSIKDDILNSAKNYADNLFEIAQNARLAIEHGAKMEELDYDLDIIVGKAKSSLKTKAHYNWSDKTIDVMKKTKVGRFVSPAVLSTSVGLAYSISVGIGSKILRSKAAAFGTLGASVALSGLFAGMNESQRLAAERAQHEIEMAEGNIFKEGDKRRENMDSFRYETVKSTELTQKLTELMFEKDKDGNLSLKNIKEADVEKVMNLLAQIDARNSLNSKKKIDLISYSSVGSVEKERTDLTILTAKAKVELRKRIESDLKNGIPEGEKSFDEYLKKKIEVVEDSLLGGEKGIDEKDKAFRKFKAKRVARKVLSTVTVGAIMGGTVQEVAALFRDNVEGFVEGFVDNYIHDIDGSSSGSIQTPLQHLSEWISGNHTQLAMGIPNHLGIGENAMLNFPEGTSILSHSDGTFDILRGDDVISHNIHLNFNPDGTLDTESISRLGEDGIMVNTDHTLITGTEEVTVKADEYINNHGGDHEVNRIGWYDNDTPKPLFDQNELKLQWGGDTGIDSDGNYEFDVSHMTSGGSFTDGLSVDAEEQIKKGALSVIFSLSDGTQDHVFELPIGTDGKVIIDPNSGIGKLFFGSENGHAVFKGRFAEVVQSFGEKDGVEQVKSLATLVGQGNDSITDTITTITDNTSNTLGIPKGIEPPMYIPFYTRSSLEPVSYQKEKMLKRLGLTPIKKKGVSNIIEVGILKGENIGKVDKVDDKKKEQKIYYITEEQYLAFKEDIKFINKKIQSSEGIAEIKESDLKSEFAKMRYELLKHIQDGKPVTWNKEELQEIGDELERILSASVIKKASEEKPESGEVDVKENNVKKDQPEAKANKGTPEKTEKYKSSDLSPEKKINKLENLIFVGSKVETETKYYLITGISKNTVDVISKDKETGQYQVESINLKDIEGSSSSGLVIKSETDFIDFEKEIENYNNKDIGGVLGLDDYYYKIIKVKNSWFGDIKSFIAIEKNTNTGEIEIVNLKEEEVDEMLSSLETPSSEEEKTTETPIEESTQDKKNNDVSSIDRTQIKKEESSEPVSEIKKRKKIRVKRKKGIWGRFTDKIKGVSKKKEQEEETKQLPPVNYFREGFEPKKQYEFKDILQEGTVFEGRHFIHKTLLRTKEDIKYGIIRTENFDKITGKFDGYDIVNEKQLRKNFDEGYVTVHKTKDE